MKRSNNSSRGSEEWSGLEWLRLEILKNERRRKYPTEGRTIFQIPFIDQIFLLSSASATNIP